MDTINPKWSILNMGNITINHKINPKYGIPNHPAIGTFPRWLYQEAAALGGQEGLERGGNLETLTALLHCLKSWNSFDTIY